MKYLTPLSRSIAISLLVFSAALISPLSVARADWVDTPHSLDYIVTTCSGPVADAGPDYTITLPTSSVVVTGDAYIPCGSGTIVSTQWVFEGSVPAGLTADIGSPSDLVSNMKNMAVAGTYVFKLTATDSLGRTAVDKMQVVVTDPPPAPDLVIVGAITPTTATVGTLVTFSTTVKNQGNQSTVGYGARFPNIFQIATGIGGTGTITDQAPVNAAALGPNQSALLNSLPYPFSAPGTYSVRACADKRASGDTYGTVSESDEDNNCSGAWTTINVSASGPTIALYASPTTISAGQTSQLSLDAFDFPSTISCTIDQGVGNVAMSPLSGNNWHNTLPNKIVSPAVTTTYTADCLRNDGSRFYDSVTVTVTSKVNGACAPTHYSCVAGTSSSNTASGSGWTWMCLGSGGGSDASCSQSSGGGGGTCSDGIQNQDETGVDKGGVCRKKPIFIEF